MPTQRGDWWIIQESNLGPGGYEPPALPIELMIRILLHEKGEVFSPLPLLTYF